VYRLIFLVKSVYILYNLNTGSVKAIHFIIDLINIYYLSISFKFDANFTNITILLIVLLHIIFIFRYKFASNGVFLMLLMLIRDNNFNFFSKISIFATLFVSKIFQ
jgi:hypothetical protein